MCMKRKYSKEMLVQKRKFFFFAECKRLLSPLDLTATNLNEILFSSFLTLSKSPQIIFRPFPKAGVPREPLRKTLFGFLKIRLRNSKQLPILSLQFDFPWFSGFSGWTLGRRSQNGCKFYAAFQKSKKGSIESFLKHCFTNTNAICYPKVFEFGLKVGCYFSGYSIEARPRFLCGKRSLSAKKVKPLRWQPASRHSHL